MDDVRPWTAKWRRVISGGGGGVVGGIPVKADPFDRLAVAILPPPLDLSCCRVRHLTYEVVVTGGATDLMHFRVGAYRRMRKHSRAVLLPLAEPDVAMQILGQEPPTQLLPFVRGGFVVTEENLR